MISTPLHLPLAVLAVSDIETALDAMAAARSRLADLDDQIRAFTLVAIFERHPSLIGFSFYLEDHFDDEGNSFSITRHEFETHNGELKSDALSSLDQDIGAFLDDQSPHWLADRSEVAFFRPAGDQSLADHMLALFLGEPAFARWQAQSVASTVAPSKHAPGRSSL